MPVPLVLLPGMMCDARLYLSQIAAFGLDRSVMVCPLTGADNVRDLAQRVLSDAPVQFALAGLSMGGIVAMEVARLAPERVTHLALLDTNPLSEAPTVAATREPQIAKVRAGRLLDVIRDEMKPNYLAPGPNREDILDLVVDMARHLGPEVFVQQSRALQRRPDQQGTLRRYRGPSLVLCGIHDVLCPVPRHQLMAELLPNADLVLVPDAGHLPTLEHPVAVNQALRHWMGRVPDLR